MKSNNLTIEYKITYKNLIEFEGKLLAFKGKELFDITDIPKHIKRTNQGWWIGRNLLTVEKAKQQIQSKETIKDVSNLQWYQQENLNHVFNL